MLVQPCVKNVPGKIDDASLAGYNHRKVTKRLFNDQMEWQHL